MAFASVLYPGRCLASQPIHLGSEVGEGQRCKRGRLKPPPQASPGGDFAVALRNRPRQVARSVLLPPPLIVLVLLRCRLRFPVRGVYPATWTAHAAPVLIHLFHCTAIIFAAVAAAAATVAASAPASVAAAAPRCSFPVLLLLFAVAIAAANAVGSASAARVPTASATLASANVSPTEAASPRAAAAAANAANAATASV